MSADWSGGGPAQSFVKKGKSNKSWRKLSLQPAPLRKGGPAYFTHVLITVALNRVTWKIRNTVESGARTVQDPVLKRGTANCLTIRPIHRTLQTSQVPLAGQTPPAHPAHPAAPTPHTPYRTRTSQTP